ncbi:hypothetical protein [Pantoea anthophila]|uniref:hypothetical protein n=1 Tax=Pantoea anthophila TaxID=470931 RepID=UPI00278095B1|nr:hypothetical protein [Pantoea anthophila]MDQ1214427.1 hypothetical protein [Pantoea anthophila]
MSEDYPAIVLAASPNCDELVNCLSATAGPERAYASGRSALSVQGVTDGRSLQGSRIPGEICLVLFYNQRRGIPSNLRKFQQNADLFSSQS